MISSFPGGALVAARWDTTLDAESSSEGSTGVLFILTASGGYVVKSSSAPAEEYFASLVFAELGLCAPKIRCVGHTETEWSDIKEAARTGARLRELRGDVSGAQRKLSQNIYFLIVNSANCSMHFAARYHSCTPGIRQRLRGPLDRPQFLVMELVACAKPLEGHSRAGDNNSALLSHKNENIGSSYQ